MHLVTVARVENLQELFLALQPHNWTVEKASQRFSHRSCRALCQHQRSKDGLRLKNPIEKV